MSQSTTREALAFEAWLRSIWTAGYGCTRYEDGSRYVDEMAQKYWECWQARAALSGDAAAPQVPALRKFDAEQMDVLRRRWNVTIDAADAVVEMFIEINELATPAAVPVQPAKADSAAVQQGREALSDGELWAIIHQDFPFSNERWEKAFTFGQVKAIVARALAPTPQAPQPTEHEPVAWIEHHKGGDNLNWERVDHPYAKATPLFTASQPPAQASAVPLTEQNDERPHVMSALNAISEPAQAVDSDEQRVLAGLYEAFQREPTGPTLVAIGNAIQFLQASEPAQAVQPPQEAQEWMAEHERLVNALCDEAGKSAIYVAEGGTNRTPEHMARKHAYNRAFDHTTGTSNWGAAIYRAIASTSPQAADKRDAERFQWYFSDTPKGEWLTTWMEGVRSKWTTDQWRAAIDAAMAGGTPIGGQHG